MEPGRMTAEGGCKYVDSAATGLGAYCFIAQSDTVLTVLAGGTTNTDTNTNFLTTIGLSGKTIKQGALIMVPTSYMINSITPSSGAVIAYKL